MTRSEKQYWTIVVTILLGAAIIFSTGCTQPPVVEAQLTGPNSVQLNVGGQEKTVPFNGINHTLADMGVPREKARRIMHSLDQQKQVWRRASERPQAATEPTDDEVLWLARAVYVEGRSVSPYGQQLLAYAMVNRIESPHWPDTVYEVVHQSDQITGMRKQRNVWRSRSLEDYQRQEIDRQWRTAVRSAYTALTMRDNLRPIPNIYHWISPCLLDKKPLWARGKAPALVVGSRQECNSISFYAGTMRPQQNVASAR